jgi:hypothetical protein
LAGGTADYAVKRLDDSGMVIFLIPFKNAILAELETLSAADALLLINRRKPGDLFPGNISKQAHFYASLF